VGPDALAQELGGLLDVAQVGDDLTQSVDDQDGLGVEGSVAAEVSKGDVRELGEESLVSGVGSQVPVVTNREINVRCPEGVQCMH
jgi:hypothetical protein